MSKIETIIWLTLVLYLCWFFAITWQTARDAGRPVWLIGHETGMDRLAIMGFRLGFLSAASWPLILLIKPELASLDPLSLFRSNNPLVLPGHLLTTAGAMLAAASQLYMGRSWRVGVQEDAVGALVRGGPYEWSRNPVFLGQVLMLAGLLIALPSLPLLLALAMFWLSARHQITQEEPVLEKVLGQSYTDYCQQVSRWIGRPGGAR